jgi:hypothetical protein
LPDANTFATLWLYQTLATCYGYQRFHDVTQVLFVAQQERS